MNTSGCLHLLQLRSKKNYFSMITASACPHMPACPPPTPESKPHARHCTNSSPPSNFAHLRLFFEKKKTIPSSFFHSLQGLGLLLILILALYLHTLHSVNSSTLKLEEELLQKQASLVASLQSGAAEPGAAVGESSQQHRRVGRRSFFSFSI